jgi:hypothetical protein
MKCCLLMQEDISSLLDHLTHAEILGKHIGIKILFSYWPMIWAIFMQKMHFRVII